MQFKPKSNLLRLWLSFFCLSFAIALTSASGTNWAGLQIKHFFFSPSAEECNRKVLELELGSAFGGERTARTHREAFRPLVAFKFATGSRLIQHMHDGRGLRNYTAWGEKKGFSVSKCAEGTQEQRCQERMRGTGLDMGLCSGGAQRPGESSGRGGSTAAYRSIPF